jgi:ComF family protein
MNLTIFMIDFLLKHTCIFCDDLSHRKIDLCFACEQNLPVLQNYCLRCAEPLPAGQGICGACLGDPLLAVKTTALFNYQAPVDKLITNLKFGNNLIGAKILGELLADHLAEQYQNKSKPEVIIPVPLHPGRLRERGYNQALELSRPIAKKLQIPIDKYSVKRMKNTPPQAKLPAKERRENIKHAFAVVKDFSYTYVAVVDDVITTGSTVGEVCKALYKAGVRKVDIWCGAKN